MENGYIPSLFRRKKAYEQIPPEILQTFTRILIHSLKGKYGERYFLHASFTDLRVVS